MKLKSNHLKRNIDSKSFVSRKYQNSHGRYHNIMDSDQEESNSASVEVRKLMMESAARYHFDGIIGKINHGIILTAPQIHIFDVRNGQLEN